MMRLSILLLMFMAISACANTPKELLTSHDNTLSSMKGAWKGNIKQFTTKVLPGKKNSIIDEIIFLNCRETPEIWLKEEDEKDYIKIYENYDITSKSGNYILSLIVDGGAWVETQTWTLVEINPASASIQWNRMVSNPGIDDNDELRTFGQLGFGTLKKISDKCDIWPDTI